MSKVIGLFDGGRAKIKHDGKPIDVGVIRLVIQQGESVPFEIKGYYNPFFRKNVLAGLKHLHFLQEPPKPKGDAQPDESPVIPAPTSVIPAEAGIQEENNPVDSNSGFCDG